MEVKVLNDTGKRLRFKNGTVIEARRGKYLEFDETHKTLEGVPIKGDVKIREEDGRIKRFNITNQKNPPTGGVASVEFLNPDGVRKNESGKIYFNGFVVAG